MTDNLSLFTVNECCIKDEIKPGIEIEKIIIIVAVLWLIFG